MTPEAAALESEDTIGFSDPIFWGPKSEASTARYIWEGERSEFVFPATIGTLRVTIWYDSPDLFEPLLFLVGRLHEIASRPKNWDGYGALPPSEDTVRLALELTIELMNLGKTYRLPQIGSTAVGGIEFEWHNSDCDLEVEIDPTGRVVGYYYGGSSEDEWEGEISGGASQLVPYLNRIA